VLWISIASDFVGLIVGCLEVNWKHTPDNGAGVKINRGSERVGPHSSWP
jgi:hypothetical protein